MPASVLSIILWTPLAKENGGNGESSFEIAVVAHAGTYQCDKDSGALPRDMLGCGLKDSWHSTEESLQLPFPRSPSYWYLVKSLQPWDSPDTPLESLDSPGTIRPSHDYPTPILLPWDYLVTSVQPWDSPDTEFQSLDYHATVLPIWASSIRRSILILLIPMVL